MNFFSKLIPIPIKVAIVTFFREIGKLPFALVVLHMRYMYVTTANVSKKRRDKITKIYIQKNKEYLRKRYKEVVKEYVKEYNNGENNPEAPIWMIWWQGENNMPPIVKKCFNSIKTNANGRKVVLIDNENLSRYVKIPDWIEEKVNKGIISRTHFSDMIRMKLLAEYGGLWLDATIFTGKTIPEEYFNQTIYTICNPGHDEENISDWRWTVSVIGGNKHNTLFESTYQLLCLYWKDHDILIDYFIFDHFINLLYEASLDIHRIIDEIEPNNLDYYALAVVLEMEENSKMYQEIVDGDTVFFKLTWKKEYAKTTLDGKMTVYANWIEEK